MKKSEREQVFNKYDGRCAYCGCELKKGWHVDHLLPIVRNRTTYYDYEKKKLLTATIGCVHPEREHIDNYMPACASCNINKHSSNLEGFRELIEGFMHHLNEVSTQYKIAKRYGLVFEDIKPVVFYFETLTDCKNQKI